MFMLKNENPFPSLTNYALLYDTSMHPYVFLEYFLQNYSYV